MIKIGDLIKLREGYLNQEHNGDLTLVGGNLGVYLLPHDRSDYITSTILGIYPRYANLKLSLFDYQWPKESCEKIRNRRHSK